MMRMAMIVLLIAACGSKPRTEAPDPGPAPDASTTPVAGFDAGNVVDAEPSDPFAQAFLDAHSEVRARYCAPPLTWSPELAAAAQRAAEQAVAEGCRERIAVGQSVMIGAESPREAVENWHMGGQYYDVLRPEVRHMGSDGFTQLVWASSERLGCGVARCRNSTFHLCKYDPPGNQKGQFATQVRGCARKESP